jgi:hypothetical protein
MFVMTAGEVAVSWAESALERWRACLNIASRRVMTSAISHTLIRAASKVLSSSGFGCTLSASSGLMKLPFPRLRTGLPAILIRRTSRVAPASQEGRRYLEQLRGANRNTHAVATFRACAQPKHVFNGIVMAFLANALFHALKEA